jgi:alpha-tubulin suppressor-like RCC1 family protein
MIQLDFKGLPKDALWAIGSHLDLRSLMVYRLISKGFCQLFDDHELVGLLRCVLHRETSLDLTTYNKEELEYLATFEKNKGRLASGSSFHLVISKADEVISWGSNSHGQLGHGNLQPSIVPSPQIIPELKKIKMVTAGHVHSLALDYQGKVYGFGYNESGRLGLGDAYVVSTPTLIPGLEKITAIFAKDNGSLALTIQGEVYEFGASLYTRCKPIFRTPHLSELKGVVTISLGESYGLFLLKDGRVFASGTNHNQRLGSIKEEPYAIMIDKPENIVGIAATLQYSLFLTSDGIVWVLGDLKEDTQYSDDEQTLLPVPILGLRPIISIVPLNDYILVVDNQGRGLRLISSPPSQGFLRVKSQPLDWNHNMIAYQTRIGCDSYLSIDQQGLLQIYGSDSIADIMKVTVY